MGEKKQKPTYGLLMFESLIESCCDFCDFCFLLFSAKSRKVFVFVLRKCLSALDHSFYTLEKFLEVSVIRSSI